MKTLKLLAMLGALGGVLLFSTGCNSTEQPIDEKYTGTYTFQGGYIDVTQTHISSSLGINLNVLTIDGEEKRSSGGNSYRVRWPATEFNYFSNHTYNFTAQVTAYEIYSGVTTTGETTFGGAFGENMETYTFTIVDNDGKRHIFSKDDKHKVAKIVEDMYTYDVTLNDDDETNLLEENNHTASGDMESRDIVNEEAYNVTQSDSANDMNLLEENNTTVSENIEPRDSVDEEAYTYDVNPSGDDN